VTRLLIVGSIALSVVATGAAVVILVISHDLPAPDSWGFRGFEIVFAFTFTWAGANLTWRQPRNAIGRIFLAVGVLSSTLAFLSQYSFYGIVGRTSPLPGAVFAGWVVTWAWLGEMTMIGVFLLLLFPDGHFLSRRWRAVAWLGALSAIAGAFGLAFNAGPLNNAPYAINPFPLFDDPQITFFSRTMIGIALAAFLAASSLFVRYRRSRGVERQQLKWLAFEAIILAVAVTIGSFDQADKWASVFLIAAIALVPLMVGIAVLRYRLYDVDVVINRAIVYGLTSAAIAFTFFAGIVVLQAALRPLTGGSEIAVAGSTLLCFALFQPVGRRMQSAIDRRFYRSKYDAAVTLDAFTSRLAGEVDLDAVGAELAAAVGTTLRPSHVSLWLRKSS
jgi:hypothetical protein